MPLAAWDVVPGGYWFMAMVTNKMNKVSLLAGNQQEYWNTMNLRLTSAIWH